MATVDIRKEGGGCCALSQSAGTQSNAMWPGPRSTSGPSGVIVHPVVWPQNTRTEKCGLCPF